MYDLSYFNLGFRSENVRNVLASIREDSVANDVILQDAYSIIRDCLSIQDEDVVVSTFSASKGYEMNALLPLVAEVFVDKDVQGMVAELEQICSTIKKARTSRDVLSQEEVDLAVHFFSRLVELCLSHSTYQSLKDPMSLP